MNNYDLNIPLLKHSDILGYTAGIRPFRSESIRFGYEKI